MSSFKAVNVTESGLPTPAWILIFIYLLLKLLFETRGWIYHWPVTLVFYNGKTFLNSMNLKWAVNRNISAEKYIGAISQGVHIWSFILFGPRAVEKWLQTDGSIKTQHNSPKMERPWCESDMRMIRCRSHDSHAIKATGGIAERQPDFAEW